ncbi:MAG: hypothetical protein ACMXX9_03400 [Candidatus Woesearchaeota archaeon]
MDLNNKIGLEIEFLTLDKSYNEVNAADIVLEVARENNLRFVAECSKCMVEFNSLPGTIFEVMKDTIFQLTKMNELLSEKNILLMPIEYPLNEYFVPQIRSDLRYDAKLQLLGFDKFKVSGHTVATHIHFSLEDNDYDKVKQINVLQFLDALSLAITSSSPRIIKGDYIHNLRVTNYRYFVHGDYPFQGDAHGLISDYEGYNALLLDEFNKFKQKTLSKGIDFGQSINPINAIWGPIRLNKTYNTVEIRSPGANPSLSMVFSLCTLFIGLLRKVKYDEEFYLELKDKFGGVNLSELAKSAAKKGFEDKKIRELYGFLLENASNYLTESEFLLFSNLKTLVESDQVRKIIMGPGDSKYKYCLLHNIYLKELGELKYESIKI